MEKQLAIKGHETRGDEIIELLEMLGGKKTIFNGKDTFHIYLLNDSGEINTDFYRGSAFTSLKYDVFTIEEFLEKFPFKINDRVINDDYSGYGIITKMVWNCNSCSVKYCVKFEDFGTISWFNSHEIKLKDEDSPKQIIPKIMKQLAIKGHETRGNEIIEILQMLGGKNNGKWNGNSINMFYFVDEKGFIDGLDIWNDRNIEFDVFTLEKFLEKFPYKVGDKIINDNYSGYGIITTMVWDSDDCCVKYRVEFEDFGVIEWFKYNEIKISDIRGYIYDNDPLHELCVSKLSTLMIDSEVCADEVEIILNDYEIVIKDGKTYAVKKKPKYPTTYEECCGVLGMMYDFPDIKMVSIEEYCLYSEFIRLIRCRDAYWKIAGEQMGLSESWKPNYTSLVNNEYFTIHTFNNEIIKSGTSHRNAILAFPTEEIRDIFFENFKELIEKCVKLL